MATIAKVKVSTDVTQEVYDWLKSKAVSDRRTLSAYMRVLLNDLYDQEVDDEERDAQPVGAEESETD